ncbi:hypothetical protein [Paraglaciecola sp. L3A3]|uniref:hypothetical protein n=1 Tax=Paraglaciecola sp. L3A3 TaxID=2686358 RepID=UPI00131BB7BF|nr:hypothetical protein [Paraglaciecola sp. L3A3]
MAKHISQLQQQVFAAKSLYREIHTPIDSKNTNTVLFNDLVQLAKGNLQVEQQKVMQQVNQSLPLRRQYIQLLETLAFATSPVQAAASSVVTEITSRKSAEFELLFKRDKQFLGQVYVILKIPHPIEKHHNQGVCLNACSEKVISSLHFPAIEDGKTQLLMEESDQKFINMFDAEFAIYLS